MIKNILLAISLLLITLIVEAQRGDNYNRRTSTQTTTRTSSRGNGHSHTKRTQKQTYKKGHNHGYKKVRTNVNVNIGVGVRAGHRHGHRPNGNVHRTAHYRGCNNGCNQNCNHYQRAAVCKAQFMGFIRAIDDMRFESDRLSAAKRFIRNNYLRVGQIDKILARLTFESNRLIVAKRAYRKCTNPGNYHNLFHNFRFRSNVNELDHYIHHH
jgi:hypothetical protein